MWVLAYPLDSKKLCDCGRFKSLECHRWDLVFAPPPTPAPLENPKCCPPGKIGADPHEEPEGCYNAVCSFNNCVNCRLVPIGQTEPFNLAQSSFV